MTGSPAPAGLTLRETSDGVEFEVRVVPRARKTAIAGIRDGALLVRLAAPPVENAANRALIALLHERLVVPLRAVRIVAGDRGRHKRVAVAGIGARALARLVDPE